MKYLSGDFVAEYNKVLEKYGIEQQEIDNRYSRIVESIVELEKKRLDSTISKNSF